MLTACVALVAGVGITLVAVQLSSAAVFFAGTVVAGAGFGAGFQGVVRSVLPHAPTHQRSGVLSLIWVVSYLALGLPAVIAGVLVVHGGGIGDTAREYGSAVMLLAALALAGLVRSQRRQLPPVPVPAPSPASDYYQVLERCG